MANSDVGTKTRSVKTVTSMYGQKSIRNISPQLDLPIIKYSSLVEDLHKSRRKLCGYKESRIGSESEKSRAELELYKGKKLVKDLTLLIERSNRGMKVLKRDREAFMMDTKVEENGNYVEVMRDFVAVKKELSRLKFDADSILGERITAEKEVDELRFKTEENLRLLESLEKQIELVNEEHFLVELGKIEALTECKEIERQREMRGKEVFDLLMEKKKRIKEMLEEAERSKDIEKELFETNSDVEMLKTQLNLVKKMERRVQRKDNSMSRSNRSFERGNKYSLSALKEVTEGTEAKKEELASFNAELFRLMEVVDALRKEVIQVKEETARLEEILPKDDVKIQKLNSKMLTEKLKLERALSAKERVSSLADNLVGSLEKLKKTTEAAMKEMCLLKEEKTVTSAETEKTKLEIDEKERELISKLNELEKVKRTEALVLEKLESLIEETMESRETESEHCSRITISKFEYEYLSRHASQAEETAEKKVVAAEAWVEALKASTKAVLMKMETLMRENGMTRVEEEREAFRTEMSLSTKRLVEREIQKIKPNRETEIYTSPKPVGKFKPEQGGKPRRYPSVGTPTFFVIKKKKKVPTLVKFFGRRR